MGREAPLDALARDLASGELSRRSALKRLAAAGLGVGAALGPAAAAEALGGGCPGDRVMCDGKCCPKNARCRRGKCRCKRGFTKCGRKCVDLDTSVKHCGVCNNPCAVGETCADGECAQCGDGVAGGAEQCDGNDLGGADCVSLGFTGGTLACSPTCTYDTSGCHNCGNGTIDGAEDCDGTDLGGETCQGLGFDGGTLACSPNCTYDTSGCTMNAVCGNGIVEAGEECDDGGTVSGDGCSATCQVEPGYSCTGEPSVCTPI